MGTKNNPGAFDCHGKAEPDEPYFTLLGRDRIASMLVLEWAELRGQAILKGDKPASDWDMVAEARDCAAKMADYHRRREEAKQVDAQYDAREAANRGDSPPLTGGSDGAI